MWYIPLGFAIFVLLCIAIVQQVLIRSLYRELNKLHELRKTPRAPAVRADEWVWNQQEHNR